MSVYLHSSLEMGKMSAWFHWVTRHDGVIHNIETI